MARKTNYDPVLSVDFGDKAGRKINTYIKRRGGYAGAKDAVKKLSTDEVIDLLAAADRSPLRGLVAG